MSITLTQTIKIKQDPNETMTQCIHRLQNPKTETMTQCVDRVRDEILNPSPLKAINTDSVDNEEKPKKKGRRKKKED